jgi:hypothetical protein
MSLPAVCLLLLAIAFPFDDAPARAQTIPPGQEALLSAMLGKGTQLPDGCSLGDGQVDREAVRTTYHCPDGDVVIQLSHPSARSAQAIVTKRFALSVANGSAPAHLLRAIEALIRSREAEFQWSTLSVGRDSRPSALFALLLLGLAIPSSISAWRVWAKKPPMARGPVLEALIVAAIVVIWLQIDAEPPAHPDTAIDVALARDCIASHGTSCLGHAASAIGLLQGQAFTYALAVWLSLGFSMRELCFVAACILAGTTGVLHHATARRFGGVAWVVSAVASALSVYMTSYPIIWNPTWFVLPLTIAFLATLAIAGGSGMWSAFVAGVAFALSSESHLLFGPFVAVAAVIALMTTPRPVVAATVLLGSFVFAEMAISPQSSTINALILRGWIGAHLVPAALAALVFVASLPIQRWVRRAIRGRPTMRESVAVLVWLLTGAVGIGMVLPWAVSRPPQVRYYGVAFPAIAYAGAWLLDAATLHSRSSRVRALAIVIFAALFLQRMVTADFASPGWFMDDGREVATVAGLANTSALDIQLIVRAMPAGALREVAAAFVGTPDVPVFPPRIVRAVRLRPDVELPDGWSRIRLARGDIATGEIDAWTHPEEAEVCPDPPIGEPCVTLTRDDFRDVARDSGAMLHRVFGLRIARGATRIGQWTRRGTRSLLWKLPLGAAGADDTHEIVFSDEPDEQIVAIDGTRWTARSDNHAVVERPAPRSAASVTVRTPIAGKFEAGVPPMPVELREEEAGVLRQMLPPEKHG